MTTQSSSRVDEFRQELCRRFAGMLIDGVTHVRIRVSKPHGKPAEVWFYSKRENHWQKHASGVVDTEFAGAAEEELADLATRGSSECCAIRTHSAADWSETDFQFPREWLDAHGDGAHLESNLAGVLFRDAHASGQDSRRRTHPRHIETHRP